MAKVDGKGKADRGAPTGAPTKVVPGAGKELPQQEQGAERTETVLAARVVSSLQTEGLLWWLAATGNSVEPSDLGTVYDADLDGRQRHGGRSGPSAEG